MYQHHVFLFFYTYTCAWMYCQFGFIRKEKLWYSSLTAYFRSPSSETNIKHKCPDGLLYLQPFVPVGLHELIDSNECHGKKLNLVLKWAPGRLLILNFGESTGRQSKYMYVYLSTCEYLIQNNKCMYIIKLIPDTKSSRKTSVVSYETLPKLFDSATYSWITHQVHIGITS